VLAKLFEADARFCTDLASPSAARSTSMAPINRSTQDSPRHTSAYGGGARLEVAPFHMGAAAHYGKGLGVSYFPERQ